MCRTTRDSRTDVPNGHPCFIRVTHSVGDPVVVPLVLVDVANAIQLDPMVPTYAIWKAICFETCCSRFKFQFTM